MSIQTIKNLLDIKTTVGIVVSLIFLSFLPGSLLNYTVLMRNYFLTSISLFFLLFLSASLLTVIIKHRSFNFDEDLVKETFVYFCSFLFSTALVVLLSALLSLGTYYSGFYFPVLLIEAMVCLLVVPFYFLLRFFYTRMTETSLDREKIIRRGMVAFVIIFIVAAGISLHFKGRVVTGARGNSLQAINEVESAFLRNDSFKLGDGEEVRHIPDLKVFRDLKSERKIVLQELSNFRKVTERGEELGLLDLIADRESEYLTNNVKGIMSLHTRVAIVKGAIGNSYDLKDRLNGLKRNYSEKEYRDILKRNVTQLESELARAYENRSKKLEKMKNEEFGIERRDVRSSVFRSRGMLSGIIETSEGFFGPKYFLSQTGLLSALVNGYAMSSSYGRDIERTLTEIFKSRSISSNLPETTRNLWKKRSQNESLESKYIRYKNIEPLLIRRSRSS